MTPPLRDVQIRAIRLEALPEFLPWERATAVLDAALPHLERGATLRAISAAMIALYGDVQGSPKRRRELLAKTAHLLRAAVAAAVEQRHSSVTVTQSREV